MTPQDSDTLRDMVRQVLLEIVPQTVAGASAARSVRTEVIASDADLQAFARRIAEATAEERAAIAAGTTMFRLAPAAAAAIEAAPAPSATSPTMIRIDSGAVTERQVRAAEAAGSRIILGRKAVLTPLARDRARTAGVEITRER
jgi:hypothetical protein